MEAKATAIQLNQEGPGVPPGECYLSGAAWVGRRGRPTFAMGIGVFPSEADCLDAMTRALTEIHGLRKLTHLVKTDSLHAEIRVIEPSDLEEMAALVRQHRAAQAAGE